MAEGESSMQCTEIHPTMWRKRLVAILFGLGLLVIPASRTLASDFIIKYYIFSMQTEEDERKIVDFIRSFDGINEVETVLDRHWVYVSLEDEILEDERFTIRVPLAKNLGYPVDRWEVQLEKPDGQD